MTLDEYEKVLSRARASLSQASIFMGSAPVKQPRYLVTRCFGVVLKEHKRVLDQMPDKKKSVPKLVLSESDGETMGKMDYIKCLTEARRHLTEAHATLSGSATRQIVGVVFGCLVAVDAEYHRVVRQLMERGEV